MTPRPAGCENCATGLEGRPEPSEKEPKMLSQLLDPKVYNKLTDRQLEHLSAVVEAELIKNVEIQKVLKKTVDKHLVRPKATTKSRG